MFGFFTTLVMLVVACLLLLSSDFMLQSIRGGGGELNCKCHSVLKQKVTALLCVCHIVPNLYMVHKYLMFCS